ncbi:MAG TPA: helix-turn-helix transcriptional regulator, partial [Pseudorhizobium sp.]|nr:helix-turn-helix transcriptional regulator [Pseudorhizobium sp.]
AARIKRQFAERPSINAARAYKTTVENLQLRLADTMAWATYDQCYPMTITGIEQPHTTREMRIFEKHEGEWRIAFLGFLDDYADYLNRCLLQLDPSGKVIWQSPSSAAALKADDDLVIRTGMLHIRDRGADQQLQAAIRRSAPLVSGTFNMFPSAVPIILAAGEDLPTKVWWVIAESGKILFSLGGQALAAHRLEAAAAVFGLSPVQKRLAAHVAEGLTLAEIAATMNITRATARTHLERIFDKTGVRSQSALVRLLLLASVPI